MMPLSVFTYVKDIVVNLLSYQGYYSQIEGVKYLILIIEGYNVSKLVVQKFLNKMEDVNYLTLVVGVYNVSKLVV